MAANSPPCRLGNIFSQQARGAPDAADAAAAAAAAAADAAACSCCSQDILRQVSMTSNLTATVTAATAAGAATTTAADAAGAAAFVVPGSPCISTLSNCQLTPNLPW